MSYAAGIEISGGDAVGPGATTRCTQAPDESRYVVSLDDAHDVERWPAAKQPIRCA